MARVNLETNPRLVTADPSYVGLRAKGWTINTSTAIGTATHEHRNDIAMFGGGDKLQYTAFVAASNCPAGATRYLYRRTAAGSFATTAINPESCAAIATMRGLFSGCKGNLYVRAMNAAGDTILSAYGPIALETALDPNQWREIRVEAPNMDAAGSTVDHVRFLWSFYELDPGDSYWLEIDNILIEKKAGTSVPVGGWFAGGTGYGGTWDSTADDSTSTADQATISSVSPDQIAAGTTVVILGTGFGYHNGLNIVPDEDSLGGVLVGSTPVTVINSWTPTRIECVIPGGITTGQNEIKVTGSGLCGGEQSAAFAVGATTPVLTTISPTIAKPGTLITVRGGSLGTSGTVTVGGIVASVTLWTPSEIRFICPQVDAGENITVSITPTNVSALTTTIDIIAPDLKVWYLNRWNAQPLLKYRTGANSWSDAGILKYYRNGAWFTVTTDHGTGPVEGPTINATEYGIVGDSSYNKTTGAVVPGTDNASRWSSLWAVCAPGTTVYFPPGVYYGSTRMSPPNGIILLGADRFNQKTGSGTWLCTETQFGSNQIWRDLLVGRPSRTVTHKGPAEQTLFNRVRFKGGGNGKLLFFGGSPNDFPSYSNRGSSAPPPLYVSSTMMKSSANNILFDDCQFEVATNSTNIVYLCSDWRAGGAYLHHLHWKNCHFGVADKPNTTIKTGSLEPTAQTFLSQMFPNEYCFRDVYTYDWQMGNFAIPNVEALWSYFLPDYPDHKMNHDIVLENCEIEEYVGTHTSINMCDNGRAGGIVLGVAGIPVSPELHWTSYRWVMGAVNDTSSHWWDQVAGIPIVQRIPEKCWAERNDMIGCTVKVPPSGDTSIYEMTRYSTIKNNTFWNNGQTDYQIWQPTEVSGNVILSGTPSYTADPYDP